ncbi:MAG: tail fiber protein [Gammaproteobacteria bacterium]|nr:tail fiber protein [Gammaproteobacteria bacterium]
MSEPYIGQLMTVGFNFPPRGWALCDGQQLAISSNTALFSLLGTTFGGDGRTTFDLPDLRGRSAVGVGNGPGLSNISWGEKGGTENLTITTSHMPSHNHSVSLHGETAVADSKNPDSRMLALAAENIYASPVAADDRTMASASIQQQNVGGGQPINSRNPFLGLYVCIALTGVYPSRS